MPNGWPNTADLPLKSEADVFVDGVSTAPTTFNLTVAIATDLDQKRSAYSDDLVASRDPATRTRGTIAKKNGSKKNLLAALRAAARLVRAGPSVTDQQRLDIGLPVRDANPSPIGPPQTFPLATLSPQGGARNALRLTDSATPTRRKRPDDAVAAEVRMAVIDSGDPIPGPDAVWPRTLFLTRAITEIESSPADVGKTLVAQSRWLGSKGQVGPWGPVETGTIAA
jgi:hypothetical protein